MASQHSFHIRNAGTSPKDPRFIIDAFDSAIVHLTATGNAGQWGTEPFSKKASFVQAARDDVLQSEKFRETGEGERLRIFIAEVQDPTAGAAGAVDDAYECQDNGLATRVDKLGNRYLAVGAVSLRDEHFAQHVLQSDDLRSHVAEAKAEGNFVFLDVLITDHRVDERRKGSGIALIEKVKQYAIENKKKSIWLDCWLGSDEKLAQ